MSKFSLILVLQKKQENLTIDMVKIQIKSESPTPFGGLFSIMEQFDSTISYRNSELLSNNFLSPLLSQECNKGDKLFTHK